MKSFTRFFSKNRGNGRGMSPGVRMESGHLKNRLPAIRYGRHFPQAGNRVFSRVVPLFPVLVYRRFSGERQPQKIVVSCFARNAGHAIRPANNFLRACVARPACSSTQKILKKDFFDKLQLPRRGSLLGSLLLSSRLRQRLTTVSRRHSIHSAPAHGTPPA